MNVLIFSLTILAIYGILSYAYRAWNRADINEKMSEIEELERANEYIKEFKKAHKGNREKQRQVIKDFNKE